MATSVEVKNVIGSEVKLLRHKKTGGVYWIIKSVKMKRHDGGWDDGVLYENTAGESFTRAIDDFHNFTVISV